MDSGVDLGTLLDERAITRRMMEFGRCLDFGDWDGYAACFTNPANLDFKTLTGFDEIRLDPQLFARFADLILSPVRRHHMLTNFNFTVDGDRADGTVHMIASHWKPSDRGASTNRQFGWYTITCVREGHDWKISRLKHDFQWVDGNGSTLDNSDPDFIAVLGEVFSREHMAAAREFLTTSGS